MFNDPNPHYDLATAVTFFLAWLGIGSLLAVVIAPRDPEPATANLPPRRAESASRI